jgi:5-methylcytosine-specific restriction enzyme A
MPRNPFYNTRTWKRLRKIKLTLNPLCEECGRMATDVDHIKAINDGGEASAIENLRSLCHKDHSRKTFYIERLKKKQVPVRGCDPSGMPLDPAHPWNESQKNLSELTPEDRARTEKQS